MIIKSNMKEYEVVFSKKFSFINELINISNKLLVVDSNVYNLYKDKLFVNFKEEEIYLIEAVETKKNINTVLELCEAMTKIKAKRNATIISFGGGIIQDITGFAANILYRGVNWIFIPTTLLAQTDSCIGSKTSLNYLNYKNLLGTFFPPDKIYIDTEFISTLTDKDFNSGLGEIIKFNMMQGEEQFEKVSNCINSLLKRDYYAIETFIVSSLQLKKTLIEEDEFDYGIRLLLNYGHTFGHAIESITEFAVPHGQAVLVGLLIANTISKNRNLLNINYQKSIENICLKVINVDISEDCFNIEKFGPVIKNDKKKQGENITAILLNNNFSLDRVHDVTLEELKIALSEVKSLFFSKEY